VRGDERRGVVDMVMSSLPCSSLIRLEVEARDGRVHAALHLFDHRSKEGTERRREDLLGQGEDVLGNTDAQEEEGGFVGEVVAVPTH